MAHVIIRCLTLTLRLDQVQPLEQGGGELGPGRHHHRRRGPEHYH